MAINQAAWLDGAGKKLRVGPAEMPTAGAGEVVVRNHAVAVNPVDWKIQDYGFLVQTWPATLGTDVAGEVVEVGEGVTRFKQGDRVIANVMGLLTGQSKHGGHQLYSVVSVNSAAILPSNIPFNEGVVVPLAFNTAMTGLSLPGASLGLPLPSLDPQPCGKTIVVWGGSSSVGSLAIQLAAGAIGAKVISVSSSRNFEFCKGCGATDVLDYNSASIVDDVVRAVKQAGGDFVGIYDAVSIEASYKCVFPVLEALGGGKLTVVMPCAVKAPANVTINMVTGVNDMMLQLWTDYVTQALQEGKLRCLPEPSVFGRGLESLQGGYDMSKAGVSAKKVVIELV